MTEAQAVALRVAITGTEEAIAKIKAVQTQLRNLQQASKPGANSGVSALRDLKNAAEAVSTTHRNVVGRLKSEWGSLTGTFRSVALGATAIGGAFYGVLKTVQAFDKAQGFRRALELNLGNVEGARVAQATDALALNQGIDINGVRRGATGLVGAGVQGADQTLKAFLALAAKGGATSEQTSRGLEQLAQIASQGKLQGDELRQIQENLVPLRKLLMDAGLGSRMGSQSNPITWGEVQRELLKVLEDPSIAAAMKAQASQSSNRWQAAMNRFQVEVIEPMGQRLGPVVDEVSKKVGAWSKVMDWKKAGEFVKKLADMTLGAADWIVKNQDLVLNIGKTIVALRAFSLALDLIKAGKGLSGALGGGASAAGGAAAGAGAATSGAVAGVASTVVAVLASVAVGAAVYELASAFLEKIGYGDWVSRQVGEQSEGYKEVERKAGMEDSLKRHNRKRAELGLPPVDETPSQRRRRKQGEGTAQTASEFADASMANDGAQAKDRLRPQKDAMGRPIIYADGATKAQRRAADSYRFADSLR